MDIKPVEEVGSEVGIFLHGGILLWIKGLAKVDSDSELGRWVGPEIGSTLLLQKFLESE